MKIKINSETADALPGETAASVRGRFKPEADIIIINGFPAKETDAVKNGDEIVLIKKGETPSGRELECMLSARHTPGVYEKLKKASAAVAGLGGLGSNAAVTMARMGVGRLKLVDFDIVEPSNLNRQYYDITQIGMKKTEALRRAIKNINPAVMVETADIKITEENAAEIFAGFGVILECFDESETKAMFAAEILKRLPEAFLIGASGVAGVFSHELFKTRRLGKNCVIVGDFTNEAAPGSGLMASRAAIAANIQANIAIRHILGERDE